MTINHFCTVPDTALCGADLAANDYKLFYENCTNCFATITCLGCRNAVREQHLSPGNFPDPEEWVINDL